MDKWNCTFFNLIAIKAEIIRLQQYLFLTSHSAFSEREVPSPLLISVLRLCYSPEHINLNYFLSFFLDQFKCVTRWFAKMTEFERRPLTPFRCRRIPVLTPPLLAPRSRLCPRGRRACQPHTRCRGRVMVRPVLSQAL